MNKAAIMNGRSLVLCFAICLLTFNVAQAQIALSTYACEFDVANTLPSSCTTCNSPVIQPVLGDDNTLTPYFYTFCSDFLPATFSLSVGVGNDQHTYFSTAGCSNSQFLALDLSQSTYASQFYWDCKQVFIYKCSGNLVFDQTTGRCVPGGVLTYGIVVTPPDQCGIKPKALPLSAIGCESLLRKTLPSVCAACYKPYVQVILDNTGLVTNIQYTYCADNGRFSIDIVKDTYPHTFFTPDCRSKLIHAIDPTRTTIASKLYWDCRYGLTACDGLTLFDPVTNKCTLYEGDLEKLPTGLETCPKTCGVIPPFISSYTAPLSYSPAAYAPKSYASPITAYGK